MKTSSLFLIGILFSSLFSITDITVYGIDDQNIESNSENIEINYKPNLQITSTDHNVLLFESVAIVTTDESNNESTDSNVSQQQIQSAKNISLTEKLSILENDKLGNLINYVKHNSEKLAVLERVYPNRIRDNTKLNFDEMTSSYITPQSIINNYNTDDLISKQLLNLDTVNSIPTFSIFGFVQSNDIFSNNLDLVASAQNVIDNVDENNQYLLVLLVPLSGYILLRTESRNNNFINARLASSSLLTVILISSAVLTPFSIGSSYWGIAYAEEFSFSGIIEDVNNLESTATTTESINATTTESINATTTESINATTTESINATTTESINATTTESINATTTESINATTTESINATTTESINATTTESINATTTESINATTTESINATTTESINATTTESINATTTESINATTTESINATTTEISPDVIIVDDTLLDLNFDTENINQTNSTTLELDGDDDFIIIQNNSTDVLSTFTISGWIKPDYSNGSNEFTIISKENSFILSINNNINPEHIAKFSIFDGIKWTYVESNSTITEQWTHISTTFDGNYIKIYINGKLDAITELADTITISVDGRLVETQVDTIYSDQDVVIGAYVSTNDGSPQSQNKFSGEIDNISLHNSISNEQELTQIYQEQFDYYSSLDVELSLEEIMQQIIQENVLATNSTLVPTNSTVIQLDLVHETIEIGKPAMWTQTIELSNKTDGITIEIPEDAEITQVTTMDQQTQETLYNAVGIMNNADIQENQINNLRIENSTDPEQYNTLFASLDEIPEQIQQDKPTKLLVVNNTADQIEIKFETPAPYVIEEEHSTNSLYNKTVTVTHDSTLHYTNVISYSDIPEDLTSKGIEFDLFWNINGTKMNVTSDPLFAVEFIDTNGNGIVDQMQWIVPQMSEQEFEIVADIVIINVQSYPVVGGTWEVRFTTNGTADLIISAINGTTFGESLPDDLNLSSIKCGENTIQHQWINGSIVIQNYTCNETGYETSQVLTPGKHHLEFRFGNNIGYANNNAFFVDSFQVNLPLGIANRNGNFLTTQVNYDRVANVTSGGSENWNSTGSTLSGPTGIAVNSTGWVYVADTGGDRIQILTQAGVFSSNFGTQGSGNNQFLTPIGITIDSSGFVYVADTGNDRITKHNKDGSFIEAYGTGFGSGNEQFSGPTGIAVNSTGYIYVADTGNDRIKILTPLGAYSSQFGTQGSGNNQFLTPIGITIDDSGFVYVADTGNDRITKHNKDGSFIDAFGSFGTGDANFNGPTGVSVFSNTDNIYTADTGNDKIKKHDTGTRPLTESLSLTATATTSVITSQSLSESLPLTALATTTNSKSESLSESLPLTALATTSATTTQSLSESLPLTATATIVLSQSLSESLPLTALATTTNSKSESLTESLPLSDTLTKSISKSLTESLPLTALATTSATTTQSLSESLPLTATATIVLSQSLSESLPLTALATTTNSKSESLTESLPLSDTLTKSISKSLTESLPLTALATTSATTTQSLSESLPLTATATIVLSQSLSESLPLTALATTTNSKSESLTESLPLSDTLTKSISKSLTESLPLTALATTSATTTQSLSESLPLTALATTTTAFSRSLTESLDLTALATTTNSKSESLTESLPLSDTLTKSISKSLTESLPLTALATTSATTTQSLSESLPLTALATTTTAFSRSLTESLDLTALATTTNSKSESLTESLPLSDTLTKSISKSLTESLPLTALATTSATTTQSLSESLPLTALATTTTAFSRSLTESLDLTALATTTNSKSESLTESLPLSDTLTKSISKSLTESLPLTATATIVLSQSLSESLPLTALATTTNSKSESLTESLPLSDTLTKSISKSLTESLPLTALATTSATTTQSLSESLPLTALATTTTAFSRSLTESLDLTALATTTNSKSESLTESLPLSDTLTKSISKSLTESLPLTALATTSATTTQSLSESLPLTALATTTTAFSRSLTESLDLTALATTTKFKSESLTDSLPLTALATTTTAFSRSLTESLPLTAAASVTGSRSVSLSDSLPLTALATTTTAFSRSLTESLDLTALATTTKFKSESLTDSLPLTALATTTTAFSRSLTESLPLTAAASVTGSRSVSLSDSLPLTALLNKNTIDIRTDLLSLKDNLAISIIPGNTTLPVKLYPGSTTTAITLAQNNTSVILTSSSVLEDITIPTSVATQLVINYTSLLSGTTVTVPNGLDVIFSTPNQNSVNISVNATISDSTILTGPSGWNGILNLPTTTSVTIPQTTTTTNGVTTTTTYSAVAAFELGFSGSTIQLSSPARLQFTGSAGNVAFFVGTSGVTTFITTQCTSDSASGMPASADECYFDNGNDLILWTDHFTKFGASQRSTSSTGGSSGSSGGSSTGAGAGKTGVGPAGTSTGFGGILGTLLTINEITYDRCEENMATILVSSDADKAPSVTVHTARSGSVSAKLAYIQPYEQSNKITKLDKYLYEIPITSDETFLMVVVTEEKGVSKNTVQAAIHLTSCEGSTVINKVPEEKYEEIASSAPKIFDVKFQIENSTQHRSETESEFSYVDNQDLSVSAIVDAQSPLQRSELRVITMGQSQEYIAIKMDVESLPISNSTYVISATIPSQLMQEPAISYWIHIIDENQNEAESKQYNIGVKPVYVGDITFEMDISSVKESGSLVRPQLFVDNKDLPSYGIVSLIVNGEVISKKSQLFATGETIVNLEWKSNNVDKHTIYDVIASVDLYDKSISTQSAKLHIYPKTITMLASDIKSLEPITENDTVLADPALIYASNSVDQNLRFHVTAPNGQCIIGVSEECAIHDSTVNQRGGLASIEYEDQIIRVRYGGLDSPLERFSITSIDPLVDQWLISLETSDGIVPQAQAMKDMPIKVKYRTHSEIITVSSE